MDTNGLNRIRPEGDDLFDRVVSILEQARTNVVRSVNNNMVIAYWLIGLEIIHEIQGGDKRAEYGEQVIEQLSAKLTRKYGRGFSTTNLRYFRTFYTAYSNRVPEIRHIACGEFKASGKRHSQSGVLDTMALAVAEAGAERGFSPNLGWSHYRALMNVENQNERLFYEIESENECWEVDNILHESEIEKAIIDNLQSFLLELGKGFAFVGRQKRMQFDDDCFYIDLVFYNCILKCYLLIDLKIGGLTHQDVGQMDSYVRMFDGKYLTEGDNPTIGLILCAKKNETIARYSVLNESKQLFASKYMLYLPTEKELQREMERERLLIEARQRLEDDSDQESD